LIDPDFQFIYAFQRLIFANKGGGSPLKELLI